MSEVSVLTLGPDCTIRTVRSLLDTLSAALAGTMRLTLDCAAVERADVTFVQIVLAADKTAQSRAAGIALVNVPPAVESAFRRAAIALPSAPLL
ncbi:STAS domain-containing protein [Methylobacterium sp. P1-11]|uniref:STAS domain-containing protein n=1 Tax=Methylobacterium sp. P1-11 TaxID=2024616 RepID=UPI0011F07AA2|nr:STAS domain-containing protein [Methylobacterium sp. P1-11]KAA0125443.1 STAS domain-containing protein [Methylobacterium sp. P1-11]